MTLLLRQARYDLLSVARNRRARVFTLAFPLVLLVILVGISTGQTTVDGADVGVKRFLVGGIACMALMASAVATVVLRRENGVPKRRRATPVPARVLVAGQAVAGLAVAVVTTGVLLVVARVAYGIGTSPTGLALILGAVVAGALAFATLAYAVSTLVGNADAAQPAVQLTMLPLYFLSGIWFSVDEFPDAVRHVAQLLPVELIADLVHRGMIDPSVPLRDVVVPAVWCAVAAVLAARRFSWLPRTA